MSAPAEPVTPITQMPGTTIDYNGLLSLLPTPPMLGHSIVTYINALSSVLNEHLSPENVFTDSQLRSWAHRHGYLRD